MARWSAYRQGVGKGSYNLVTLLNAVRIRRDNKDGVLHTTKLDIKI